jgi:hypothetical protein
LKKQSQSAGWSIERKRITEKELLHIASTSGRKNKANSKPICRDPVFSTVIPAEAGIQIPGPLLDSASGLSRSTGSGPALTEAERGRL